MVASSPVRHEPPPNLQPNPVEVQSYQAPWKALSEFAMGPGDMDPHGQAPFQQLVSAFGDSPLSDDDSVVTLDDSSVTITSLMSPMPNHPPHHPFLHLHHQQQQQQQQHHHQQQQPHSNHHHHHHHHPPPPHHHSHSNAVPPSSAMIMNDLS